MIVDHNAKPPDFKSSPLKVVPRKPTHFVEDYANPDCMRCGTGLFRGIATIAEYVCLQETHLTIGLLPLVL